MYLNATFEQNLPFPFNLHHYSGIDKLSLSVSTVAEILQLFNKYFIKKSFLYLILNLKDFLVLIPAPSSVKSMCQIVVSAFFILPLLSSAHALLANDLLPFLVKRKVLCVVTCFFIVPDLNGLTAITIFSIVIISKLFCVIEIDFNILVKGQSRYSSITFGIPYVALVFF